MFDSHHEHGDEHDPPPAFSDALNEFSLRSDNVSTSARITGDGRININVSEKDRRLSALIGPAIYSQLREAEEEAAPAYEDVVQRDQELPPSLNIVIHVVGSRGDVQPFIALGLALKTRWNHRVRIATHSVFKDFVEENGLEFFSIGGDPAQLMAFMVKHPGLLPGIDAITNGDVRKRREVTYEILEGCWRSCIEAAEDSKVSCSPFVADVIIANPPSFAHIHCAQKLGVPLHIMFTMPWSSTQAFPHPLANIQSSNAEAGMINFLSYYLVETMIWQGLGGVINKFRQKVLNLEYISSGSGPRLLAKSRIPHTYCWSPSLIQKPKDWGRHITTTGFFFLPLASTFTPEPVLAEFLASGPAPIYIGFGSIVVDDPGAMTSLVLEAVARTGQRALISQGWGGLGAREVPDGVLMIGNVPHDWLFSRVSCVVHHGGAGTTAAGIAAGRPTVIVHFFGDQQFWGNMIARTGAGPKPIPSAKLTAEALALAITTALHPSVVECAEKLKQSIAQENGCEAGAISFHNQLRMDSLRCPLSPRNTVVWRIKRKEIRVSALAAAVLLNEGILQPGDLKIFRQEHYMVEDGPWDPITATLSSGFDLGRGFAKGFADVPVEIRRAVKAKQNEVRSSNQAASSSQAGPSQDGTMLSATRTVSSQGSSSQQTGIVMASRREEKGTASLESEVNDTKGVDMPVNDFSDSSADSDTESELGDISLPQSASMPDLVGEGLERHETESSEKGSISAASKTMKITGSALKGAGFGFSKGVGRILFEGFKGPFEMTTSLARGFHNMPKIYGDDTVRQPDRITGVGSGLKAGGKQFTLGVYDGISGFFTQPVIGAKKDGVVGFATGVFKGTMGMAIKPSAGTWGLLGYPVEGIAQQFKKMGRTNVKQYVRVSRLAQGFEELKRVTPPEQARIVERWYSLQAELKLAKKSKKKGKGKGKATEGEAGRQESGTGAGS